MKKERTDPQSYNLPLLRKRLASMKDQYEKLGARIAETEEMIEDGENASIIAAVRGHNITPEALVALLQELRGLPTSGDAVSTDSKEVDEDEAP